VDGQGGSGAESRKSEVVQKNDEKARVVGAEAAPMFEAHSGGEGSVATGSGAIPRPEEKGEKGTAVESGTAGQGALMDRRLGGIVPYKTFRIAVSGDVILSELECAVIDTREFQRLHSVKELGTAYLVYSSAKHTRFEHSIGTVFEAERIMNCVENNPKSYDHQKKIDPWERQVIRLAALLHDIGHLPFGHTLEDELNVITQHHESDEERRRMLLVDSPIGTVLRKEIGQDHFDLLLTILRTKHADVWKLGEHAYMADIVNNTLCADLLDYLRRDLYFCFLQENFGDRFMKYLYLDSVANRDLLKLKESDPDPDPKSSRRLVVRLWKRDSSKHRRDVLSELIDLLRTRYTLGEKVYYHPAKASSSAMISRAVLSAMKSVEASKLTVATLSRMGDDELLLHLSNSKDSVARGLSNKILNRQLHKSRDNLTRMEAEAAPGIDWTNKMIDEFHKDADHRTEIENELASLCGLQPGDVLIYCPDQDMGKKYAQMIVNWKDKNIVLRDVTDEATKISLDAIERSHELLWGLRVFVTRSACDNNRCIKILKDFSDCYFRAHQQEDGERSWESALRNLVNEQLAGKGTVAESESVVSKLVGVRRGGSAVITMVEVDNAIREMMGKKQR
jgi:HD superfamily phosphohydrolase